MSKHSHIETLGCTEHKPALQDSVTYVQDSVTYVQDSVTYVHACSSLGDQAQARYIPPSSVAFTLVCF